MVRAHLAATLVQLRRPDISRRASKVRINTGHRVGHINHLVSIQAVVMLKDTLVALSMGRPSKTCQGLPPTDKACTAHKAASVNRISPTPRYLVANTPHHSLDLQPDNNTRPSLARLAHNRINPSPARQAPSITRPLVLQLLNTTNLTPAVRVVHRTQPSLICRAASIAHHSLVHQADSPTPPYRARLRVNITKLFPDHQPTNMALPTLPLHPTRPR